MVKGCGAVMLSMILSSGFALAAPTPADDCSWTAYRLRRGVFTSGGSRLWSSLGCASVGSGSSKSTSHMIHAASGTRFGSSMSVPTRLCPPGGRFATPSDATSSQP